MSEGNKNSVYAFLICRVYRFCSYEVMVVKQTLNMRSNERGFLIFLVNEICIGICIL